VSGGLDACVTASWARGGWSDVNVMLFVTGVEARFPVSVATSVTVYVPVEP